MYLSIPDIFFVPICYIKKDILDIKIMEILQKRTSFNNFTNETINKKELVIGVSLPTLREARWVRDKKSMEDYAKIRGVTLKIENADTDVAKQASQVDSLISQGIDILILAPTDSVAAIDMVEKANKAGIKVIAYDRFIVARDLYVSFDNIKVGEFQGQYLTERVPKGNYIILSGDPGDRNSAIYKEGALKYIKPLADKGDIKIVTDKEVINWDPKNAFKIVERSLIENNNKIDAILAPNDATAGAAIEALKAQGLAGKVLVTGQDAELDAIKRIIQGTQGMTIFKDTRQLARVAIDAAIRLATEKEIEINHTVVSISSILLAPIAIDKNNIDSVLIDSGYYTKEEVYKM
jgi:D-xylose transport system substrate-binding protein